MGNLMNNDKDINDVIPILNDRETPRSDKFMEEMRQDPSIKSCGKFHLFTWTIWWYVSKFGFSSTVEDKETGHIIKRITSLEISKVSLNDNLVRRLIIGRLLISVGHS